MSILLNEDDENLVSLTTEESIMLWEIVNSIADDVPPHIEEAIFDSLFGKLTELWHLTLSTSLAMVLPSSDLLEWYQLQLF